MLTSIWVYKIQIKLYFKHNFKYKRIDGFRFLFMSEIKGPSRPRNHLVYVPGFGDHKLSAARRAFFEELALACGGLEFLFLERGSDLNEILILGRENGVLGVIEDYKKRIQNIDGNLIFLGNSIGASLTRLLQTHFGDRVSGTILLTPPKQNDPKALEEITKGVLRSYVIR